MKAIIFHKDTELILAEKQKEILKKANSMEIKYFPFYPLFLFLSSSIFENIPLEKGKKLFQSVRFLKIDSDSKGLFFLVNIEFITDKKNFMNFDEKLYFALKSDDSENSRNDYDLQLKSQLKTEPFELTCKTFQFAEIKKTEFITEIINSVWIKIKRQSKA